VRSLTRKTDYALIALVHMVRGNLSQTSARDLSLRSGVPVRVLTNILNRLTRRGLVASARGTNGGYRLARRPEKISLVDLMEAVDGPLQLTRCCVPDPASAQEKCRIGKACPVSEPIRRVYADVRGVLSQVTLLDLALNRVPLDPAARVGGTADGRGQSPRRAT